MVDELGEAWRHLGHYGGSHGRYMAALGTVYSGYWGTHGGTGDNMVEVLRNVWRYWRAVWWEYRKTPGGTGVSPSPLEQLRGITRVSPGPSNKLEG